MNCGRGMQVCGWLSPKKIILISIEYSLKLSNKIPQSIQAYS
jgi:hypothetical protein